jgi:hypothetical protein
LLREAAGFLDPVIGQRSTRRRHRDDAQTSSEIGVMASKLGHAVAKARAQDLLDNALLSEAFKGQEDGYTAAWRATVIEDVAARENFSSPSIS